jgi:hypothetical protein
MTTKLSKKTIIISSFVVGGILLTTISAVAIQGRFDLFTRPEESTNVALKKDSAISVSSPEDSHSSQESQYSNSLLEIQNQPSQDLSEDEKKTLLYMLEEEKLARDVYLTLAKEYDLKVFSNIAKSEQTHIDTLKLLVDKYGLDNPIASDEIGQFNDSNLAKLYVDLTTQGSTSNIEALKVGATIEDLDIKDLNEGIKGTDNTDIQQAYQSLLSGSYNHMRAFVNNLKNAGGQYTPQFISQDEYDQILSSTSGNGNAGGGGNRNR